MQEQYIDEPVFKCLTLECDLGSAVNRLITQPGQFASIYHKAFGEFMLAFFFQCLTLFFRVFIYIVNLYSQSYRKFWMV